jgi:DNA polymerase-3 subunit epsilon
MILFFDTETTGFYNERLAVDHPSQPHIVQLAAQLCEADGSPAASFSLIVNPGVDIPARAASVHGITNERAARMGVPAQIALSAFEHLYQHAETVVAHNISFDRGIIETASARHGGALKTLQKSLFCTMKAATPIINMPPTDRMRAAGFTGPKSPKLEECIRHFFGEEMDGAHDAMVDVAACRRVFLHLKSLEARQ